MKEPSLRELIAMGECVSPLTADRCPVCIDCCEAFQWKRNLSNDLNGLKITLPEQPPRQKPPGERPEPNDSTS